MAFSTRFSDVLHGRLLQLHQVREYGGAPAIILDISSPPLRILGRQYFATFRRTRYLGQAGPSEGAFRSHDSFRGIYNGRDVIVSTNCNH